MKWGLRRPSLRKRIAARLSIRRFVRQSLGLKAPRGWGWVTNPRRALYNRIYYRTTFSIGDLFRLGRSRRRSGGCGCLLIVVLAALLILVSMMLHMVS